MRRRAEPTPAFASEAEERRFLGEPRLRRARGLQPRRARASAQSQALDGVDFAADAGEPARAIEMAAHKRDVPYQSLIKIWLAEKLDQG